MTDVVRNATLEWAHRAAAGELKGLEWAGGDLRRTRPDWTNEGDEFHATSMAKFAPETIAQAVEAAQQRGEPTALEGLQLVFARVLWMARTRHLYWTPDTPIPRLLASLVEAHGVGRDVHRDDPENLVRITARLPTWRRRRGELEPALRLLSEGTVFEALERLEALPDGSADPRLADEVFACHSDGFWAERCEGEPRTALRIEGGWLRFQDPEAPAFTLRTGDVLVEADDDEALADRPLRLLPAWTVYRPVLSGTPEEPPQTPATVELHEQLDDEPSVLLDLEEVREDDPEEAR